MYAHFEIYIAEKGRKVFQVGLSNFVPMNIICSSHQGAGETVIW